MVKNPPADAGDTRVVGKIPGLGRSPGGGPGDPLQYSCLEKSMDIGLKESDKTEVTSQHSTAHIYNQHFSTVPQINTLIRALQRRTSPQRMA